MSAFIRSTVRTTALAGIGVGAVYTGYKHYNSSFFFFTTAHAESLPSDSQTSVKKFFTGSGFYDLKLKSSEIVNHNVKKLTFELPEAESITGISPITSLLSKHTAEGAWIPTVRPYTPVSDLEEPGSVSFMVKKYPNGAGSSKMHSLVPGDKMSFKTLKEFDYKPNEFSHITCVAGGSGITPIYQLTRYILKNPNDNTKISLIFANNTEEDIILKSEFEDFEKRFPERFQKLFVVSKPTSEGNYEKGYVTKEILRKVMPNKMAEKNVKVLVSGPPAMIEAVAGAKGGFGWTQGSLGGALGELGYKKEEVHKF